MAQNDLLFNQPLKLNAYAKINLFLEVIRRLPDGYHEIMTLFSSVDLCDTMSFYLSKNECAADFLLKLFKINFKKPQCASVMMVPENIKFTMIADEENEKCLSVPLDKSNTVIIALKKLMASVPFQKPPDPVNFYMIFQKNIPAGAGLGGGSSDAAVSLVAASKLLGLGLDAVALKPIGRQAGADIPFMLEGGCCSAGGAGERFINSYDIPASPMIIVYPNFEVSSKDAYVNVQNHFKKNLSEITANEARKTEEDILVKIDALVNAISSGKFDAIAPSLFNRLEDPVLTKKHQIKEIRDTLVQMGYRATLMTGSGSAVFTLLDPSETPEAHAAHFEKIQTEIKRKFSRTYRVFLTKTRKAMEWEKMLS